jgi:hypothetical protein
MNGRSTKKIQGIFIGDPLFAEHVPWLECWSRLPIRTRLRGLLKNERAVRKWKDGVAACRGKC